MQNFRTLGLIIKKGRHLFTLSDESGNIIQCARHEEDRHEEDERRGHPHHVLRHLERELAALAEYDGDEVRLVVTATVTALSPSLLGRRGGGSWSWSGLELVLAESQQSLEEDHHGGLSLLSLLSLLTRTSLSSLSSKES